MRPIACMVTGSTTTDGVSSLLERIDHALDAGVDLVQIRQPALDGGPLLALVRACVARVGRRRARVIVNDRVDVAMAGGAHGVHLRSDSMAAASVRAMVPRGFLIGRSVHGVAEAQAATADGGLDYLICGTIFTTSSKPGQAAAGLELLAAVAAATPLPVLAIGGVTLERIGEVHGAGAAGFAAIELFGTSGAMISGSGLLAPGS